MGNASAKVKNVLNQPLPTANLLRTLADGKDVQARDMITDLLKGATPSNFNLEDICDTLRAHVDNRCIIIPWWMFHICKLEAAALCIVKHWPAWTDEEVRSSCIYAHI